MSARFKSRPFTNLALLYSVQGGLAQKILKCHGFQLKSVVLANSRMSVACVAELRGVESTEMSSTVTLDNKVFE